MVLPSAYAAVFFHIYIYIYGFNSFTTFVVPSLQCMCKYICIVVQSDVKPASCLIMYLSDHAAAVPETKAAPHLAIECWCEVVLGSCWARSKIVLCSLWGRVVAILGSFWGLSGVVLGSCWGRVGVVLGLLGSFWDRSGVVLGSFWGRVRVVLGSCWDRFAVVLGSC